METLVNERNKPDALKRFGNLHLSMLYADTAPRGCQQQGLCFYSYVEPSLISTSRAFESGPWIDVHFLVGMFKGLDAAPKLLNHLKTQEWNGAPINGIILEPVDAPDVKDYRLSEKVYRPLGFEEMHPSGDIFSAQRNAGLRWLVWENKKLPSLAAKPDPIRRGVLQDETRRERIMERMYPRRPKRTQAEGEVPSSVPPQLSQADVNAALSELTGIKDTRRRIELPREEAPAPNPVAPSQLPTVNQRLDEAPTEDELFPKDMKTASPMPLPELSAPPRVMTRAEKEAAMDEAWNELSGRGLTRGVHHAWRRRGS
jgi:hypothetical protein